MPTPVDWGDSALMIGQSIQFEIRHARLSNVLHPECYTLLARPQLQLLLQFVQDPQVVLNPRKLQEAVTSEHGVMYSERALDDLVDDLRIVMRKLDPASVYIRTLPRLGYVLVCTVRRGAEPADCQK